ncbi:unnamed protein product [Caenorhabditis auriculariae]|uniref:7TM GPCR serpentine receptor class x (Srx) domain-containing protein n=1 Tax=Caenorhabditis auriculariae TaxID=2777116 RepID=A0A8S1H510_9PELO|nr:unnamed protein product [Caenorhabditis auriculariae]
MGLMYGSTIWLGVSDFLKKQTYNPPCRTLFLGEKMMWLSLPRETCAENMESMLAMGMMVGGTLLLINFITFGKIIHFQYKTRTDNQSSNERIRRNILLWFQTILQDLLYSTDFVFTAVFGPLKNERWWAFLSYTFIWENVLTLDG